MSGWLDGEERFYVGDGGMDEGGGEWVRQGVSE